jgi:hypothetical protein
MRHRRAVMLSSGLICLLSLVAVLASPLRSVLATPRPGGTHGAPPSVGGLETPPPPGLNPQSWWDIYPGPNPGNQSNVLRGVATISANDMWAVGDMQGGSRTTTQTLAEHWDGTAWNAITSPSNGTGNNQLNAAAAVASNDVWAVGWYYNVNDFRSETLIEHWNGTNWSIVPSPNIANVESNSLSSVAAVAANNVWAVGDAYNGTDEEIIEHWDGSQWTLTTGPAFGSGSQSLLNGIAAVSASDIWAVGGGPPSQTGNSAGVLMQQWNGSQWTVVPIPAPSGSGLLSLSARSANDIWAAGGTYASDPHNSSTLIEHWDGTQWTVIPTPSLGTGINYFYGISVAPDGTAYAVGQGGVNASGNTIGLIERWDGKSWSVQTLRLPPSNGTTYYYFYGMAALSWHSAWAVGFFDSSGAYLTLAERYQPVYFSGTPPPCQRCTYP